MLLRPHPKISLLAPLKENWPCADLNLDFRIACSIPTDDNELVITGGGGYPSSVSRTVSVYNINGWVRDLVSFNTERSYHACGQYKTQNGDKVSSYSDFIYNHGIMANNKLQTIKD